MSPKMNLKNFNQDFLLLESLLLAESSTIARQINDNKTATAFTNRAKGNRTIVQEHIGWTMSVKGFLEMPMEMCWQAI